MWTSGVVTVSREEARCRDVIRLTGISESESDVFVILRPCVYLCMINSGVKQFHGDEFRPNPFMLIRRSALIRKGGSAEKEIRPGFRRSQLLRATYFIRVVNR